MLQALVFAWAVVAIKLKVTTNAKKALSRLLFLIPRL